MIAAAQPNTDTAAAAVAQHWSAPFPTRRSAAKKQRQQTRVQCTEHRMTTTSRCCGSMPRKCPTQRVRDGAPQGIAPETQPRTHPPPSVLLVMPAGARSAEPDRELPTWGTTGVTVPEVGSNSKLAGMFVWHTAAHARCCSSCPLPPHLLRALWAPQCRVTPRTQHTCSGMFAYCLQAAPPPPGAGADVGSVSAVLGSGLALAQVIAAPVAATSMQENLSNQAPSATHHCMHLWTSSIPISHVAV
jgi:hypothetical protein